MTHSAPPEKSKFLGSGGSMVARLKLKGIDGRVLPYQLSMVVYWTTMAITGNGELGFDSGEGA